MPPPSSTPTPSTPPAQPPSATGDPDAATAAPSRLVLSSRPGVDASDGVWWPRTADLATEVPLLDVAVQERVNARIARIGYERAHWSDAPGRIRTSLGITHLGWFEHSRYPDHVLLSLSDYQRLVLTVLLPDSDEVAANAALESASD
ncbi:DUF5994 family protein [Terrabacter aerolatus]|nr:DUF5994 family protein [Terrabacter aerolatus]